MKFKKLYIYHIEPAVDIAKSLIQKNYFMEMICSIKLNQNYWFCMLQSHSIIIKKTLLFWLYVK